MRTLDALTDLLSLNLAKHTEEQGRERRGGRSALPVVVRKSLFVSLDEHAAKSVNR